MLNNWITASQSVIKQIFDYHKNYISTYQWRELLPYSTNIIKRTSKKRKGYLTDTGLACYLQHISTPNALAGHPLLGALFETWAVNEVFKFVQPLSYAPRMYHWRSSSGAEVDLVLELDGKLFPIEVKCKSSLTKRDQKGLHAFRTTYCNLPIQPGLIIYAGKECMWLDKETLCFPWNGFVKS